MPELPDVEGFKSIFDKTSMNKKIVSIEVKNTKILDDVSPLRLKSALEGECFCKSFRHGKHLFAQVKNGLWLQMHFGMTGYLKFFHSISNDPSYDRLLFSFSDGTFLSYVNMRMFGKVGITQNPDEYIKIHKLGPDALGITKVDFKEILKKKKRTLKAFFMDQEQIAGIGNDYSDEILFHSRLNPVRSTQELSEQEITRLYDKTLEVLKIGINRTINGEKLPDNFLINYRKAGKHCPVCDTSVMSRKFSNRNFYFCPNCQK
jgi:formamidopyrimidine-DNA glycosylase